MPKFISVIYFEGRILCFTEFGDVYEYTPRLTEWRPFEPDAVA